MQPSPLPLPLVSTDTQSLAILYKTAEVAPGEPRVEKVSLTEIGTGLFLRCPNNGPATTDELNDRPPLLFQAVVNFASGRTYPLTVIVNHPRSLIDIESEGPPPAGFALPTELNRCISPSLTMPISRT